MSEPILTYTEQYTVYRHDGDHHGRLKVAALFRYAQQIATAHAMAVGLNDALYAETHTAYVLAKVALHIEHTPRVDEVLTLTTKPEQVKHAVNKRITHVCNAVGEEVALLDSRWVLIDTEKRTILRKHPEQFNGNWLEEVPEELPVKLTKVPDEECETLGSEYATYDRCDMNGHMNNTRYIDVICNALPLELWDEYTVRDLRIVFHKEVPLGGSFVLKRKQITPEHWFFSGWNEGKRCFEAEIELCKESV